VAPQLLENPLEPTHRGKPGGLETMDIVTLLLLLLVAGICGAVGKAIAGGVPGGLLVTIAIGFIGALLGPWLATKLGLPEPFLVHVGGHPFPVLWSIIGAALFVAIIHLVSRRR
jgi:uncharacterized membrane protein YeaQ/YmgE (transglycosylase-associated protein family)